MQVPPGRRERCRAGSPLGPRLRWRRGGGPPLAETWACLAGRDSGLVERARSSEGGGALDSPERASPRPSAGGQAHPFFVRHVAEEAGEASLEVEDVLDSVEGRVCRPKLTIPAQRALQPASIRGARARFPRWRTSFVLPRRSRLPGRGTSPHGPRPPEGRPRSKEGTGAQTTRDRPAPPRSFATPRARPWPCQESTLLGRVSPVIAFEKKKTACLGPGLWPWSPAHASSEICGHFPQPQPPSGVPASSFVPGAVTSKLDLSAAVARLPPESITERETA